MPSIWLTQTRIIKLISLVQFRLIRVGKHKSKLDLICCLMLIIKRCKWLVNIRLYQYQTIDEFDERYTRRAGIEGTLSQGV